MRRAISAASLAALALPPFVVACGGGGDAPTPPPVAESPGVSLGAKLPRRDLRPTDSMVAADGEAVVLRWTVTGDPSACEGRGAWRGAKSAGGGRDTTPGLSGPRHSTFTIRCQNDAGAAADTAEVVVGAPGAVHSTSNRPDRTTDPQVKLFYAVAFDDASRELDLDDRLQADFAAFQERFSGRAEGATFRVDRYDGGYDVTFVRVPFHEHPGGDTIGAIVGEIEERGLLKDRYTALIYYDSEVRREHCGQGADGRAFVWVERCGLGDGVNAGHGLLHALGFVDADAPHARDGHVTDHERDLMDESPPADFVLDHGRDDYYSEDGLPPEVANLAESPVLVPGSP